MVDRSPGEAGWYDLFSRGARDWLRHNDKVRDAVRQHLPQIVAGADVLNGGATHGARAGAHARALPLQAALLQRTARRRPGPGQARRSHRPSAAGQRQSARPGRQRRRRHPVHARIPHRRHRRLAVGRDAAAESRSEGRPRQGRRLDARRLGPPRRALAPRSAPLDEGIDQAARHAERQRRTNRPPSPTTTCAIASSPSASSRRCRRW